MRRGGGGSVTWEVALAPSRKARAQRRRKARSPRAR